MERNSIQEILTTVTDTAVSPETLEKLLQDYEFVSVLLSGVGLFHSLIPDLEAAEDRVLSSAGIREGKEQYRVFFLLKRIPGQDALKIVESEIQVVLREPAGEEAGLTPAAVRISDGKDIPGWVLRNLLLGALSFDPDEPERSRIGNGLTLYWGPGRDDREFIALNYRFDAESVFHQNVLTYTELSAFSRNRKGEFQEKALSSEPLYRFLPERKMLIRVSTPENGENLYIRKRRPGRAGEDTLWSSIPATESGGDRDLVQRWKKFEDSRLEELRKVVKKFNETFEKYGISIWFQRFDQTGAEKTGGTLREKFRNSLIGEAVRVVNPDPACDKDAAELAETLRAASPGLQVRIGSESDPEALNLLFLYDRGGRKGEGRPDPCRTRLEVQQVSYKAWEEREGDRPALAWYWLLKAAEKRDIQQGHISLTDSSMLKETMYFAKDFYDPNRKRHHDTAMRLEPDGTIEFACSGSPEFERCFPGYDSRWFRCRKHRDNVEYAVRKGSSLNLVRYTRVRALVPPRGTAETHDGQEGMNPESLGAVTVRIFRMDGKNCFLCSIRYGGEELETGPVVREIIPVGNSQILLDELLPLLCVDSVRLNQLTVVPFPILYMREYLRQKGDKSPGRP